MISVGRNNSQKSEKIMKKSKELALGSTFIGLPNIFRTERLILKFMWIVLLSIATLATIIWLTLTN